MKLIKPLKKKKGVILIYTALYLQFFLVKSSFWSAQLKPPLNNTPNPPFLQILFVSKEEENVQETTYSLQSSLPSL